MYQSACCLLNWAEVSRRRVGAKQEEEGGKKQSSWSRRDRVCVVPALNGRHGYGGAWGEGGIGGCRSHRHPCCAARWERL